MTAWRGRARDLPERPPVSAPRRQRFDAGRARLAHQPGLGVAGITLVVPVAVVLGAGLGSLERSLLVLGPMSTFALPVIAAIAFWWDDWPGTMLQAPLLGLSDTLLVAASGVVLTIAGQAVVAHVDLDGVFDPGASPVHAPTFPATMALGGAIFTAMLQVTLVAEGCPLRRLPRIPAGIVALAVAWTAGVGLYAAVIPTGLLQSGALGSIAVCIGALQVACYVVLRGWPFAAIEARVTRLAAANVAVIAGGCLAYLLLAVAANLRPVTITAAAGTVVAAGLVVGMLFEGWLDSLLTQAQARVANMAAVGLLAALLYIGLQALALAGDWTRAEPEQWTAHAALNAIGAGVILHVAIGRRWPFAQPRQASNRPAA
jgi:hypothetical protein